MRKYILYNPLSGNEKGEINAKKIDTLFIGHELIYHALTEIYDYKEFFGGLSPDDDVIICGGDGTLNRFINSIRGIDIKNPLFYYAIGSGNDFLRDLEKQTGAEPFLINYYLKNLPEISVNGMNLRFLNGAGYGLDGFVCAHGNELRKKTKKKINYTALAIRDILFFRPKSGKITIDGETHEYKKVWMASVMKGRYFGGGMMVAPDQEREDDNLTIVVLHDCGILGIFRAFPTIFKGKHLKFKKIIDIYRGRQISMEFNEPCPLQLDGETISDVNSYTVYESSSIKATV